MKTGVPYIFRQVNSEQPLPVLKQPHPYNLTGKFSQAQLAICGSISYTRQDSFCISRGGFNFPNLNQIAINKILIFLVPLLFQNQTELHQFWGDSSLSFMEMGQTDLSQWSFVEGK